MTHPLKSRRVARSLCHSWAICINLHSSSFVFITLLYVATQHTELKDLSSAGQKRLSAQISAIFHNIPRQCLRFPFLVNYNAPYATLTPNTLKPIFSALWLWVTWCHQRHWLSCGVEFGAFVMYGITQGQIFGPIPLLYCIVWTDAVFHKVV